MAKKRFSISTKDQKNARKSLEELANKAITILDDSVQGGFVERIAFPDPEKSAKPKRTSM